MRPLGVVVLLPAFDQELGFIQSVKNLAVEKFISELANERFHVAVLPRTAGFDEQCLDIQAFKPASYSLGCKLCSVIRADVSWNTFVNKQITETM